jgi:hypothetical protein
MRDASVFIRGTLKALFDLKIRSLINRILFTPLRNRNENRVLYRQTLHAWLTLLSLVLSSVIGYYCFILRAIIESRMTYYVDKSAACIQPAGVVLTNDLTKWWYVCKETMLLIKPQTCIGK